MALVGKPGGNALLVAGASGIWASARSLRVLRRPAWLLAAGPSLTALAAIADDPASNPWAGDPLYLAVMCLVIGLAARELWQGGHRISGIRRSMAIAAGTVSVFYCCRFVTFFVDGPSGPSYNTYFGSAATTLVGMAFLAVASFSMFALSSEHRAGVLRTAATRDGLTGLLNRTGYLKEAETELHRMCLEGRHGSLILADLDHFKAINDGYGHAAGDAALKEFASACSAAVRSNDLVGRLGGEEFVLLLPGASPTLAQAVAADISDRLEAAGTAARSPMPTASYGIIPLDTEKANLDQLIAAADAALYTAKSLGRNRAVIGAPVP